MQKLLSESSKEVLPPAQLFQKLMGNDADDHSSSNDSAFYMSMSKRLECFNAVLARDKSSSILNSEDEVGQPLILTFLNSIVHFISKCLPKLSDNHVVTTSSTETSKYLEACGDCFKITAAVLKPRLRVYVSSKTWLDTCEMLLTQSTFVLKLKVTAKDCVTSAAMTHVASLYIRAYSVDEAAGLNERSSLGSSLQGLLKLLDASHGATSLTEFIGATGSEDTHTELSVLTRCALLRATISVFDDDSLCLVLLQDPIYPALTAFCQESIAELKQYALQTLSTWLDRIGTLLANLAHCSSLLRPSSDLESRLRQVMTLLVTCWTHPARQVTE